MSDFTKGRQWPEGKSANGQTEKSETIKKETNKEPNHNRSLVFFMVVLALEHIGYSPPHPWEGPRLRGRRLRSETCVMREDISRAASHDNSRQLFVAIVRLLVVMTSVCGHSTTACCRDICLLS